MGYVTRSDLIKRFGSAELEQLTDRDNLGGIDDSVLNAAIADASATADSYLQQVRTLPLDQVVINASPLSRYVGDIVLFYLYTNGAPLEYVAKAHDRAIQWLRDVAAGKASLGAQDAPAASGSGGKFVTAQGVSNMNLDAY